MKLTISFLMLRVRIRGAIPSPSPKILTQHGNDEIEVVTEVTSNNNNNNNNNVSGDVCDAV